MKKILSLSIILAAAAVFVPQAMAADSGSSALAELNAAPQIYTQRQRINRRGARIVTRTRIVRRGFRTYREVWQYRYQPNGRVVTRLLSRTRIR
jgi:hypothetical protein